MYMLIYPNIGCVLSRHIGMMKQDMWRTLCGYIWVRKENVGRTLCGYIWLGKYGVGRFRGYELGTEPYVTA